jgi:pSer/pThr/pTyr-binding forkhead associated (FHA) protein
VEETTTERGEVKIESAPRSTRRIVGWIVSYTLDPMGVDYRIFEGTNTIGRDSKNTIPITKDPTISGEHVVILYRSGKFKIKDKMTANGTFLNDVELEVEEAYDLGDGDVIRVGNTTFKFKSAES